MLDLTVLAQRFERITDARPPAEPEPEPAVDPGATQEWVPDFADEPPAPPGGRPATPR
jgi:hypothetical protein